MIRLDVRNDDLKIFSIFLKYTRILEPIKELPELKSVFEKIIHGKKNPLKTAQNNKIANVAGSV